MFITAGPITKLFAGGGGGEWTTCAMIDDEPRPASCNRCFSGLFRFPQEIIHESEWFFECKTIINLNSRLGESRDLALGTRLFKLCVGGAQGRGSAGASAAGAQAESPETPGASG